MLLQRTLLEERRVLFVHLLHPRLVVVEQVVDVLGQRRRLSAPHHRRPGVNGTVTTCPDSHFALPSMREAADAVETTGTTCTAGDSVTDPRHVTIACVHAAHVHGDEL